MGCIHSHIHQSGYQYKKLPRGDYFRYLVLHPGTGNEPLECTLRKAKITNTTFEAISYVWGSNSRDQEVICKDATIRVTRNLANVLRRLRSPHKPRNLWADGICIDQDNTEERGHQVAIMGHIYRAAERVLISMGPDDNGYGSSLCTLLKDVDSMIEKGCMEVENTSKFFPWPDPDDPILRDHGWYSLYHLLGQPWFSRGWVVREAAFAQQALVLWGDNEFDWASLMRTYCWLIDRGATLLQSADLLLTRNIDLHRYAFMDRNKAFVGMFNAVSGTAQLSVLKTLSSANVLRLADPRDRVYAFMELSQNSMEVNVYPDYTIPYLEVYRQFAVKYITATKDLTLLDYIVQDDDNISTFPSWIPQWDIEGGRVSAARWRHPLSSHTRSAPEPCVIDDTKLKVRGVVFDSVKYVSGILHPSTTSQIAIRNLWDAVEPETNTTSPYELHQRTYAFLDTLCIGRQDGREGQWHISKRAYVNALSTSRDSNTHHDTSPAPQDLILNFIRSIAYRLRFFVSERGYMGLAPTPIRVGDKCGIIFGSKLPCILRAEDEAQHYKHTGAAHVTGKASFGIGGVDVAFSHVLGDGKSKDWVGWEDVEEQDIYLC